MHSVGLTLTGLFGALRLDSPAPFLLDRDGGVIATYGDAAARSGRLAHELRSRGVGVGDRLAMRVHKSPEAIMLYLACVRSGVALLPMNPAYMPTEIEYLVGDAEPALVVDEPLLAELVSASMAHADRFDDLAVGPDDLAAILYTSGTTGRPKGAMLSHRNLASNAATLREVWGFCPDDVLLHVLPIFHTHGLFVAVNCCIANGTPMVFLPRFDVAHVLAAIGRCTVMMGVPTHYTRLLAEPRFDAAVCSTMRLFISGSAPLLASIHEQFAARTGHAILERYGMTETSMITSNPLHGERRPGTVGFPLPGVELRVADGEVGVLEVRGPNVFTGYWRRPELSATEFTSDGFFATGDVGMFDADGYVHLVGRAKDLIISGGLNVYPIEIEAVIDELPGVLESAVIGVADDDLGEAVVAVVVCDGTVAVDPFTIREQARALLAGFKVPKRVHIAEALPRNAMGKIEKASLRSTYATGVSP